MMMSSVERRRSICFYSMRRAAPSSYRPWRLPLVSQDSAVFEKLVAQVVTGHRRCQLEIRRGGGVRDASAVAAAAQGAG